MLIKQADCQAARLAELQLLAQGSGVAAKRAEQELAIRNAGIRGEKDAAYLIDFEFASSNNWAVIHDLRLEHGGRVAQIDHLLINRWMDVYALETKSVYAGIKITEEGEFLRLNTYRKTFYEGMASPLEQNERHIQVLRDVMKTIDLPMRLGLRILPSFQSFVMISPSAKIIRPKRFDASRVIKADQLKKSIWRDIDNENSVLGLLKTAAKIVSSETVELVARQLAALHRPLPATASSTTDATATPMMAAAIPKPRSSGTRVAGRDRIEPTPAVKADQPRTTRGNHEVAAPSKAPADAAVLVSACKACESGKGSILSGKYGYYFKCVDCNANTAIRFTCQPGHTPRLRGERGAFFRDCPQCATSVLFHSNPTSEPAQ